MYPRIFHIYGPIWIYSYGLMLALGFLAFLFLTLRHPIRKKIVSADNYLNIVFFSLVAGIVGGRLLFIATEWGTFRESWLEIFYPWVGGLVILGSILGILITLPFYLKHINVSLFPLLDLGALYAPIIQIIARVGCFLAGCCYGAPALEIPWAVTFTHPEGSAPLHIPLHPTQLYTSLIFVIIFFLLKAIASRSKLKPGQLLFSYLAFENIARFSIDFLRGNGDRGNLFTFSVSQNFALQLSQYQLLSLTILCVAIGSLLYVSITQKSDENYFK